MTHFKSIFNINIQIYAFDSDVNDKNAFDLLKIILHLYHLVE